MPQFWSNAARRMTNNPLSFTVTSANATVTAVFASLSGTQMSALTVFADGAGTNLLRGFYRAGTLP